MSITYPSEVIRLVAIDPGSMKCGISYFEIDFERKKILRIVADNVRVESLANDTGYPEEVLTPGQLRYYKLRNEITRRLIQHKPHYVAYEGPFMNTLQPSAYGPLVSVMTLIHDAVIGYNLTIPFHVFQPQVVKKAIGISGKKGKEIVIEALSKVDEVMSVLETDIESLDDNGVDSIVVGYTFFKEDIRKTHVPDLGDKGKKKAKK